MHTAHLAHLADLRLEVVEVETFARLDFPGQLDRLIAIDLLVRLLDQRQHIAHAEDARGHALRVENLEAVELLGDTGEFDRRAGYPPHRQCRAATRIAVEFGQHDAGQRQRCGESLGRVDRILALHCIDDEQRFHRAQRRVQRSDLAHHRLVDREPPSGVDDQHVVVVLARPVERSERDGDRLSRGARRKAVDAELPRQRRELLHRRGPVHVAAYQQHFLARVLAQEPRKLGRGRRLAGTLQAR